MIKVILLLLVCMTYHQCMGMSWNVTNWQFATIATAVSFSSETRGVVPVSDNGAGSFILETHDGGLTFHHDASPQVAMYMAGSCASNHAVASGMLNMEFASTEIATYFNFTASIFDEGITSQNADKFRGSTSSFAVVGQTILGGNGVAITTNGGLSYKWNNISILKTEARYGAFPSDSVWYVSAGEWPNNQRSDKSSDSYQLTSRWHLHGRKTGQFAAVHTLPGETTVGNSTGWKAQIVKTTNGGKDWESVYYVEGKFYFNQIDCIDENNCVAVGEADTSDAPGTYIFTTSDGGKTWKQAFHSSNPADSLMAARYVDSKTVWAAGGTLSSTDFVGNFYQSTDGGQTWTNNEVKGVYANDIAVGSSSRLFATAFNYMDVSSFMVYS